MAYIVKGGFFRGTTPTHIFELSMGLSALEEIRIVYKQGDNEMLSKKIEDCTKVDEHTVSITLTQEETYKFDEGDVLCQVKAKTLGRQVIASAPWSIPCKTSLDDEVM